MTHGVQELGSGVRVRAFGSCQSSIEVTIGACIPPALVLISGFLALPPPSMALTDAGAPAILALFSCARVATLDILAMPRLALVNRHEWPPVYALLGTRAA